MAQAYYSPFVIDHTKVPSDQTNFPVLLLPTDTRFSTPGGGGGHQPNANGYSLRPYSDAALTSAMTYELVPGTYNATTGFFEMWVLVPTVSASVDTTIYLGYGDASLTTDGSSTSTWPSSFQLVSHQPNGSSLSLVDSTSNARNGTNASATAIAGKIDGGTGYSGTSQSWSVPHFTLGNATTRSFWVNMTSLPAGANLVAVIGKRYTTNDFAVYVQSSGKIQVVIANNGAATVVNLTSANAMSTGSWYKWDVLWDGIDGIIRFNGAADSSGHSGSGTCGDNGDNYYFGQEGDGTRFATCKTDEIQMLNVTDALNTSTTKYNNQSAPSTFSVLGSEVAIGGSSNIFPRFVSTQPRLASLGGMAG